MRAASGFGAHASECTAEIGVNEREKRKVKPQKYDSEFMDRPAVEQEVSALGWFVAERWD
jgi:hypothetical protein